MSASPVTVPSDVAVEDGPLLLAGAAEGPSLAAHRGRHGDLPHTPYDDLEAGLRATGLRGRGGAAFPFLVKLQTVRAARGRAVLVVNLAEGEPVSAKDHALATTRPHLVLDGLAAVAAALRTRDLHVVVPAERPAVGRAIRAALAERRDRVTVHVAAARFVSGQSRAVLELMAGREGLPVTDWAPAARSGHRGRPTLLSNAETWAQVGLLALHGATAVTALGTPDHPGTALLTLVTTRGGHRVVETPYGTPLEVVLGPDRSRRPVLVGGFHGRWLDLWSASHAEGPVTVRPGTIGAGALLSLAPDECPGAVTVRIVSYLAAQSARRCGPCRFGLPALGEALTAVVAGAGDPGRVDELTGSVDGRGACAHPDGTARLVRSLHEAYPGCASGHRVAACLAVVGALP